MSRDQPRRPGSVAVGAGLLVALGVSAVVLFLVGPSRIVVTLRSLAPVDLVGIVALSLGWLVAWSLVLFVVLGTLGVERSPRRVVVVYAAITFVNSVTPFAQLGGEVFAGLIVSRNTDADYRNGLAAAASVDTINVLPSALVGLAGLAVFASTATLGRRLDVATIGLVALVVALVVLGTLAWRGRDRLVSWLTSVVVRVGDRVAPLVPRLTAPDEATVARHLGDVLESVERIAVDRRGVALGLALSTLGWVAQAAALWLTTAALGVPVHPEIPLFVVPVAAVANVLPLPGGVGGVEAVMIGLLVATAGLGLPTATAATLIYRLATFWLPVLLGAGALAVLEAASRRAAV